MKKNLYEVTIMYSSEEGEGKIETPDEGTIVYVVATDPANAMKAIQARMPTPLTTARRIYMENLPYHFIILDQPEQP